MDVNASVMEKIVDLDIKIDRFIFGFKKVGNAGVLTCFWGIEKGQKFHNV